MSNQKIKKMTWTKDEDDELNSIITSLKSNKNTIFKYNWNYISSLLYNNLNKKNPLPNKRNGKQCRERWINHLSINKKKFEWNEKNSNHLFSLAESMGRKWKEISNILNIDSDHIVKNYYYSCLRKRLRLIRSLLLKKGYEKDEIGTEKDVYKIIKDKISYLNLDEDKVLLAIKQNKSNDRRVVNINSDMSLNILCDTEKEKEDEEFTFNNTFKEFKKHLSRENITEVNMKINENDNDNENKCISTANDRAININESIKVINNIYSDKDLSKQTLRKKKDLYQIQNKESKDRKTTDAFKNMYKFTNMSNFYVNDSNIIGNTDNLGGGNNENVNNLSFLNINDHIFSPSLVFNNINITNNSFCINNTSNYYKNIQNNNKKKKYFNTTTYNINNIENNFINIKRFDEFVDDINNINSDYTNIKDFISSRKIN